MPHIDTRPAQAGRGRDPRTWAISTPIYQTSTYAHPGLGQSTGFERLITGVCLIAYAESFGGVESLITVPAVQTHANLSPAQHRRPGAALGRDRGAGRPDRRSGGGLE